MQIDVGGAVLELPDGAPPEAIKKAVTHFRSTPEFDAVVDKRLGAPAQVRMLVGSAPLQDRLANLQRYYPDAVPYGDDNFVFTDPETGRATLYNPTGFDAGDLASVGREVSQFVGGGFGAVAGAPFGGPVGAAVGAGAGAAAGGAAFDAVMNLTQGRIDSRGPLAVVLDTAVDFGANAVGQRVGEMVGYGLKRAIGGGRLTAQRVVESFRRLGIDAPPAGAASGSRTVGMVETTLRNTPGAAAVMQEQAEQVLQQVARAADDVARSFGPVRSQEGAGRTIKAAAKAAIERVGLRQSELYDQAYDLIGDTTPVRLPAVQELRRKLAAEINRAPRSFDSTVRPILDEVDQLLGDAGETGLEFGALRQLRSDLGRRIGDAPLVHGSVKQQGLKRIYAAVTEDLGSIARAAGPDAERSINVANRHTRLWENTAAELMRDLARSDADEKAFRAAMAGAFDGGTSLNRMRRHFLPEHWDVVAGSVLGRLGRATPGAQDATGELFSVSTFMTNWSRLAPEAKEVLFGGTRYAGIRPNLDSLVEAVSSLKGMERLANTSNTGSVVVNHGALMGFMAAIGAMASGNPAVASGFLGQLGGSWGAAKLITSKSFLDWLVRPVTTPAAVSAHLGRLYAIAEVEPEIREEIYQFVEALRSAPEPQEGQQ